MEVNDITKEMFLAWQHDPVTQAVIAGARKDRENVKEALAQGAFREHNEIQHAIGYCRGLAQFDNINFQEDDEDANATSGMEGNSQA